jgi:hypothetical protein
MTKIFKFSVFAFLLLVTMTACAGKSMKKTSIVLLQPEAIFQKRISDIQSLGVYINAVEAATLDAVNVSTMKPSTGGFVVLAIRPNRKTKVWLDFNPTLPPNLANSIITKVETVTAPSVVGGLVAFALKFSLSDGTTPSATMPAPVEWSAAAKKYGRSLEVSELIETIWPK